ncbi:hypothetical protein MGMO_43c00120 [Methyloglobulus morosus KoM1]|uniref:Uncharacterized protein n=1 Tax=Methyloglobulus morosus KoM1 TaxID=1116472 RepID=V5C842_9GAMM|nr:hypothetical protein MGMO_43c00120 [Methyloglobulus morosus KoM1]
MQTIAFARYCHRIFIGCWGRVFRQGKGRGEEIKTHVITYRTNPRPKVKGLLDTRLIKVS